MQKKILTVIIAIVLVVVIVGATAATLAYQSNRPYVVWSNVTYAGTTSAGSYNQTATSTSNWSGSLITYFTFYNYTFTVKTNTLTLMAIHDHCATIFPDWSGITYTYAKTGSHSWAFNVAYNESGPVDWVHSDGTITQQGNPSQPPLTQTQLDATNVDFASQNT